MVETNQEMLSNEFWGWYKITNTSGNWKNYPGPLYHCIYGVSILSFNKILLRKNCLPYDISAFCDVIH